MNKEFRAASNEKLNLLDTFGGGEDVKRCCELLKSHMELVGIAEIAVI